MARTAVEVDQSIKIENLSAGTVLAYSDHICEAILIPAPVKRILMEHFRLRGKSRIRATVQIFAMASFLLLERAVPQINFVMIDTEYTGYETDIGGILLNYLRRVEPEFGKDRLMFRQVGKLSRAHQLAISVHRGKIDPDRVLQADDFFGVLNLK